MKKRILATIAMTLALVMTLSGCSFFDFLFEETVELTAAPLNAQVLVDFKNEVDPNVLFESDGWSNGDVFNVVWKKHNVVYDTANGIMRLGITEEKANAWLDDKDVEFKYTAGEARTQNYYHYGDYEISMKPSANPGTASTFFICTGPYDLKDGVANPHDEIDIEFLGKDTTKVQFNFFVDGKGGNEYMYDLGFDASKEFHRYGFRWAEDSITWFVDGVPVYQVTTNDGVETGRNVKHVDKLPSTAGRMLTNYWCGNERAYGWMGEYKGAVNDKGTEYQWIATSAVGAPLNPPVVTPPVDDEDTEIDWTAIEPIAPTFATTPEYNVVIDGNKAGVTYTDVNGSAYKPIEMDVTEAVAGKNYLYLKVTNNGSEMVQVRVNMYDPTLTGNNTATNISATMNGQPVFTDTAWGGSFFEIPAGETAELVLNFAVGGVKLQLMIDSSRNDSVLRSGDITIEDIKFTAVGEVEVPHSCKDENGDDVCDECGKGMIVLPSPADPEPDTGLQFEFWTSSDNYTANGHNIKYNGAGNAYSCAGTDIASLAAGKTTFTVTITNNGTAASRVRVDIQGENKVGEHTVLNTSATGGDVWTDAEWGGSIVTVEPGQSVTLVIEFDVNTERGDPVDLIVFVDAARGDGETYSSDITLSGMAFSGEAPAPEEPKPEEPKIEYTDLYVEYKTDNAYTLVSPDQWANQVRVTYTDIAQNSWNNINIWVADKSADCTVFSMKLTNHGEATVSVWVQMKDAAGAELINQNVDIAAGEEKVFTFEYTGTAEMIYFFVDSTHEADAAVNAGDITISELKLGKVAATEEPGENEEALKLTFNTGTYTIDPNNVETDMLNVSYADLAGGTYANVCANVADIANDYNAFTITIKNNGESNVRVRIDIKATNTVGNTNVCNQSSQGGGSWTDLEWGGSFVDVAAGAEATVTVYYDANGDFGPATELLLYFDTSTYGDTNTYSGNLTISGFEFFTAE